MCVTGLVVVFDWRRVRGFKLKVLLEYEREQARSFGSSAGLRVVDRWIGPVSSLALALFEVI